MAWQSSLVIMVRQLINDLGSTEDFTDARIEEAVAVGAILATNQYPFETSYTINLEVPDISPDPTVTYDPLAIALFSLKAACILDVGKIQTKLGNAGIKVKDGDSEVDTTSLGNSRGYDSVLKNGSCGTYEKLVETNYWKTAAGKGVAVFGPYGNNPGYNGYDISFDPRTFFDEYLRY